MPRSWTKRSRSWPPGIAHEVNVLSAHRDPEGVREYALGAEARGLKVIIAGAGKAAALPGVVASMTDLPVIGVPIRTRDLGGLDSLLSMVQMPPGCRWPRWPSTAPATRPSWRRRSCGWPGWRRRAGAACRRLGVGAGREAKAGRDDRALLHPRDGGHLDRRGPHGGLARGRGGGLRGLGRAGQDPRRTRWTTSRSRPASTSSG